METIQTREGKRKGIHYSALAAGASSLVVSVGALLSAVLLAGLEEESLCSGVLFSGLASLFPELSIFTGPPRAKSTHYMTQHGDS